MVLKETRISTMLQGLLGNQKKPRSVPFLLSLFLLRGETKGKKDKTQEIQKSIGN